MHAGTSCQASCEGTSSGSLIALHAAGKSAVWLTEKHSERLTTPLWHV